MIKGIHHISMKCGTAEEIAAKVKAAGYELFIEPNNKDIPSDPVYPIRMAFCYGPLGEQVEFFMER